MATKYLFARIFIYSPDNLEPGYKFINSLSAHISNIGDVHLIKVERYAKIEEYIKLEIDIKPNQEYIYTFNILLFFIEVLRKLGSGWTLMGTDYSPEAIWNDEENSSSFVEEIRWMNIIAI